MPKYIDLLRSHLNKGKKPADDDAPKPEDEILADEQPEKERLKATEPKSAAQQDVGADMLVEEPVPEKIEAPRTPPIPAQELEKTLRDEQTWTAQTDETASSNMENAAIRWLKTCVQHVLHLFQSAASDKPASMEPLFKHTQLLVQSLMKKPESLPGLELQVVSHDHDIRNVDYDLGDLIAKSMTLMLYALKMGLRMRLNESEMHTLVLAAMLHHIGMAQISTGIRHKKDSLSSGERDQVSKAPGFGEAYLKSCGVNDAGILTAASQAPERYDGSGPRGLSGNQISNTARTVGLLSVFEALITFRPYRKRLLPRDAISVLIKQHKEEFDQELLKYLIESISMYPVGSYVQLNSGDIGQIIVVHQRLPLRPKVRVNMDRHGNGIVPRIVDLRTQPNLRVSHCMYQEELSGLKDKA